MTTPELICPAGHQFPITAKQAKGDEASTCPECGWHGTPLDGGTELVKDDVKAAKEEPFE